MVPSARRALLWAGAAAGFHLALLAAIASGYGWNPSCFLHIGEKTHSHDHADLPAGLVLYTNSHGYDGLHYYQLARDPLLLSPDVAAPFKTDKFITRHQRVLYPLLAHAAALGRETWIPLAMVGVNLLAVAAAAAVFFRTGGPLWGWFAASLPALSIGLFYGLTEPVSLALAGGALAAWRAGRHGWAGGLLALAGLARETSALFGVALAADRLRARDVRGAFGVLLAALLPPLLYSAWLQHRLETPPPAGVFSALSAPLAGFWTQVRLDLSAAGGPLLHALPVWGFAAWAAGALGAALARLGRAESRPWVLATVLHAFFFLCSYQEIWTTTVNAGRIAAGLSLSVLTWAAFSPEDRAARWTAWAALPLHAAVLARILADRGLPHTLS